MPGFINIGSIKFGVPEEVRCWLIFTKAVFPYVVLTPETTFVRESGLQVRMVDKEGKTDFATTPPPMWNLPCFDPERFVLPATFHDDLYRNHCCLLSRDDGVTFVNQVVDREWCDDLLEEMMKYDVAPSNKVLQWMYHAGVRLGGRWCW